MVFCLQDDCQQPLTVMAMNEEIHEGYRVNEQRVQDAIAELKIG